MASRAQLAILKKGVEAWNKWREENPDHYVDLTKAELNRLDLVGINFSKAALLHANFASSNLSNANLSRSQLGYANFHGANLTNADFLGSNLTFTRFSSANLKNANLSETLCAWTDFFRGDLPKAKFNNARIHYANFNDTVLFKLNFTGTFISNVSFSNVDISKIIGLEEILHGGPSSVGIDTIYLSQGKIPESFLRGCGVPEEMIAYIPSLVGSQQAVQYYSSFISHSTKDSDFTQRLHNRMQQEKLRVWYAPEDLKGGKKLHDQIDHAIRFYDKLLIVLSKNSMESDWVRTEIKKAFKQEKQEGKKKLFPISICSYEDLLKWELFDSDSGRDLAEELRAFYIPDFSKWKEHDEFETAFTRLIKDMQDEKQPIHTKA